jgi:hypothetical protein
VLIDGVVTGDARGVLLEGFALRLLQIAVTIFDRCWRMRSIKLGLQEGFNEVVAE